MLSLVRKSRYLSRPICQCHCSTQNKPPTDGKSTQKIDAEKQDASKSELEVKPKKKYDVSALTKEDLQWRTPWHEVEGKYFSALRAMSSDDNQRSLMKTIQSDIDLRPSAIKNWWVERKAKREAYMQQYIPERNQMLGNELAAAHFLVHRGGAVKFYGHDDWIKKDQYGNYKLPRNFESDKILQAIDCSDMRLYYEGLANFRGLRQVQWLSFNNVALLDDWYLDKITNMFSHSLLYLDIRNCPNITERGIGAIYKMPMLKILCIDNMLLTTSMEMTCLLLQEVNPALDIRMGNVEYIDAPTSDKKE